MQLYAVIVAGGSGSRMGSAIPKQFLLLKGEPILMHSIRAFHAFSPTIRINVVLPAVHVPFWEKLVKEYRFDIAHTLTQGGDTRFQSVKNGLSFITDQGVVAIHDGVRPLVSQETITKAFRSAFIDGNGIPALPFAESVRIMNHDNKSAPVDRVKLRIIQTPQVFLTTQILDAYTQEFDLSFTDDASVAEKKGYAIFLTEGNPENIKITSPTDLLIAENLFNPH